MRRMIRKKVVKVVGEEERMHSRECNAVMEPLRDAVMEPLREVKEEVEKGVEVVGEEERMYDLHCRKCIAVMEEVKEEVEKG